MRHFRLLAIVLFFGLLFSPFRANAQLIQSVASGLSNPFGVAVDHAGNVYIADTYAEVIRVLNTGSTAITVAGVTIQPRQIEVVAGNGTAGFFGDNGPALSADLYNPTALAVDGAGNIYIADLYNQRVRVVNAGAGLLTVAGVSILPGHIATVAGNGNATYGGDGGPAGSAGIYVYAVALDSNGNIYIADTMNERIRLVNAGTSSVTVAGVTVQPGQIQTVAGNGVLGFSGDGGVATSAELTDPYDVAVDASGNIYICDSYNREIRVVDAGTKPITVATIAIQPGQIKTVAGNGTYGYRGDGMPALTAEFADPDGVQVDSAGNIYVSDTENERLRMVNNQTGLASTVTGMNMYGYNGDGIPANTAWIAYARTIAVDSGGNIYFADEPNNRIREIVVNPGIPVITSRNSTAFTAGVAGSFTLTTADLPVARLTEAGALPSGVKFVDNGNGTGTLSGTASSTTGSPYQIIFQASNGVSPNATQSFTLTIYPPGGGPVAAFVGEDGSTEGKWLGTYGADGYSLANVSPQAIPAYATFSVQNQVNYTWDAAPTSARALQLPGGSGSIAAAWYSNSSFYMDVNVGAGTHPFAIYCVDWDNQNRTQTVQVFDANTGALLDTRSVSGFANGVYLDWNLSGHVQMVVTPTSAGNAVVSGAFFGGTGVSTAPILSVTSTHGAYFAEGQQNAAYTLTVSNLANVTPTAGPVSVTEALPSGLTLVSMSGMGWACTTSTATCTRGDALNGGASYPPITVTVNVAAEAPSPQVNQVTVSGGGAATQSTTDSTIISGTGAAAYAGSDSTTQGSWMQKYGVDGYVLANAGQSLPSYDPTFAMAGESHWTWAIPTTDPRALQTDSSGDRIAAAFYTTGTFSMDVNIPAGQTHQIALYAIDWDGQGRSETIQILDASSGATLDTRSIPNANTSTTAATFKGGTYLVWNVSGHVTIQVTLNGGPNAVLSGVFFGGEISSIVAASGTPQSAPVNSAFASLTATVMSGGSPVVGAAVTFTAPTGGASGTFAGGASTAIATTDATGTASAPTFSANGVAGGPYNVTATIAGLGTPANFVLTNLSSVGPAASIAATAGTPQSAALNAAFGTPLQATVQDAQHNPVSNVPVTFSAPTSGASGTFAGGLTTAMATTNGAGVATAPAFTANATTGGPYTVTAQASGVASAANFLLSNTATSGCASACASFLARDTSTTGNHWAQSYGLEGYSLANSTQSLPGYDAAFTPVGNAAYTWSGSTADTRALRIPGTSLNIAATWYNPTKFTLDANVGPSSHQLALYAVDWDQQGRAEIVQLQDANSGATLDTETISGFSSGVYLVWNITGHVKIVVTATAGPNAVISAAFFGGPTVAATATILPQDTQTSGNWPSKYGASGYVLAGVTAQNVPAYASFAALNQKNYTWAATTGDSRALLVPGTSNGIAAAWYSAALFSFDVNVGAGTHSIAFYALDWDNQGRSETVQITDALTGTILSTEQVSSFSGGVYLGWNVSGHVNVTVIPTGGPNAVVSGAFFQ